MTRPISIEQTAAQFPNIEWDNTIAQSVAIKHEVVSADPKENGLRKILNFGHTLGHAIETYYLNHNHSLLHGEAIAVGMILEAFLSYKKQWLAESDLQHITQFIVELYGKVEIPALDLLHSADGPGQEK